MGLRISSADDWVEGNCEHPVLVEILAALHPPPPSSFMLNGATPKTPVLCRKDMELDIYTRWWFCYTYALLQLNL